MSDLDLKKEAQETWDSLATSSESFQITDNLIKNISITPIRDFVLRSLYENPDLRKTAFSNLRTLSTADKAETFVIYTIMAGCAWLDGQKEITRGMLDLALEENTQYSLARLLDVALTHDVPARVWADSLSGLTLDDCLAGAK